MKRLYDLFVVLGMGLLLCVSLGVGLCLKAYAESETADDFIKIANKQAKEKELLLQKIKSDYKAQYGSSKSSYGYFEGVSNDLLMAIRLGAIHDGQPVADLENIFGKDSLFWPEGRNSKLAIIPVNYRTANLSSEEKKHFEGTSGRSQWHLFVYVDAKRQVTDLVMRCGSLQQFMEKGLYRYRE
jgi:hypothetical protein